MSKAVQIRGPVVAVKLAVPRHMPYVEPFDALAEINTAYPQTFIQEGIGTSLGLPCIGTMKIVTAPKLHYEVYQYKIRIAFMDHNQAFETTVAEVPYMLRPTIYGRIKCIIGRDILQFATLTYNGPDGTFSLEFAAGVINGDTRGPV